MALRSLGDLDELALCLVPRLGDGEGKSPTQAQSWLCWYVRFGLLKRGTNEYLSYMLFLKIFFIYKYMHFFKKLFLILTHQNN
jgi:hypothetical protein